MKHKIHLEFKYGICKNQEFPTDKETVRIGRSYRMDIRINDH